MPNDVIKACLCDRFRTWFSLGRRCVESNSNVHGLISWTRNCCITKCWESLVLHGEYNVTEKVCYLEVDRGRFCFSMCFFVLSSFLTWTVLQVMQFQEASPCPVQRVPGTLGSLCPFHAFFVPVKTLAPDGWQHEVLSANGILWSLLLGVWILEFIDKLYCFLAAKGQDWFCS